MCHAPWRGMRHPSFPHAPFAHDPRQGHEHHGHPDRGGPGVAFMPRRPHDHDADPEGRWSFGVRRPLRFLAHQLELNEQQFREMSRILEELKIERVQAEVDDRRALADFADAVSGEAFDAARAESGGERRVQSAVRIRETLNRALQQLHAMLTPVQRERLAYLIRSGVLSF